MNYNKPDLINALSAEYVLGTLRGKARDRFETLKFDSALVQERVNYWESRLNSLSMELEPVEPGSQVWAKIKAKLYEQQAEIVVANEKPSNVVDLSNQRDRSRPWQMVTGLAVAASILLAVLFIRTDMQINQPVESVVVFINEESQALWSLDIKEDDIIVKTTSNVPRLVDNDYQLWMVPSAGTAPISIGVMKQTELFRLKKPAGFNDLELAALAISREPLGGSPTGAPTTVLYAAEIVNL